jgi:plastocyanin
MTTTRRFVLAGGGGLLALAALRLPPAVAAEPVIIVMTGTPDGSRVWFDPIGLHIMPGQTVRWTNRDKANSHTATAYAAALDRPQRLPDKADAWDSGYLLPDDSFEVTLTEEGVYDYYCLPHEHAGMVGRIVVGAVPADEPYQTTEDQLPEAVRGAFPTVAAIIEHGEVRRAKDGG